MTDFVLHDSAAARICGDAPRRLPAAVILGQDSRAIGCALPPGTLRRLAARFQTRRPGLHALPAHGWRDVAAAWLLMALAISAIGGWLTLQLPGRVADAQAQSLASPTAATR